jgi:hypothetical protein
VSEASNPQLPLVVQSLVGRLALPFYLRCLQSLLEHCEESIRLLIHEDGSLQENDREYARSKLGKNTHFVDYETTEERTLDHLSGQPHCQAIRKNSLWGMEFFDPLFAQPDAPISYYIDADILFLRPFSGLFAPEEIEGGALFLRDTQWDAYSLRPWHLFGFGMRPVIVKGITTALVCWDKRAIDWDYLEWFLGQNKFHCIPEWVMPTVQAGLASKCGAKVVSPSQLTNLYPNASIEKNNFGVHLLGSYRDDWLPKVEKHLEGMSKEQSPAQVTFEICKSRCALAYASNQAKRWINSRLNRW